MKRGSVNVSIGAIGVPGTGKSTWALWRVRCLQAELGAYAVAHDPSYRLPDAFPNGKPSGIRRFNSVADARAALASDPTGVLAIATVDAGEVLKLGVETSKESLKRGGDQNATPCIVLVDEIVAAEQAGAYRLGDQFRESLALRRHQHLALVWTTQSPQLAHYQLLSLGTELALFRVTDERALKRIEQAGVPHAIVVQLPKLPDHKCIVHKFG